MPKTPGGAAGKEASVGSPFRADGTADQAASPRMALTYQEAGSALGVSPRTIWQLVADGQLRAVRVGRRSVRIARVELERFLAAAATPSEINP